MIDNDSADRDDRDVGAAGAATVGCADTSVGTSYRYFARLYAVDSQVDSGRRKVRGIVTDANGDTAEATARVYVILNARDWRHVLRGAGIYRILGRLLAVPDGINLLIGDGGVTSIGTLENCLIEGTAATL